jgi:murein L,D-transpeptidase YcbB/YkuD
MFRLFSLMLATFVFAISPLSNRSVSAIPAQDSALGGVVTDGIMRDLLAGPIPRDLRTFGLSRGDLLDFYARRNYQPLFYRDFNWRADTIPALKVMQAAGDHGLKPANYWAIGMDDLSASYDLSDIARRDLVLTAATLRYASDILNGRYPQALKQQPSQILLNFDDGQDLAEFLSGLAPQKPEYLALQKHLASIRALSSQNLPTIDEGPLLGRGARHETVRQLRAHLIATGDYTSTAAVAEPTLFDATLAEAVKAYQARNGLSVDGIIGSNTKKRMNTSPTDRLGLVLANLERLRWEEALVTDRHVRVNIANFTLVARKGAEDVLNMAVVVGRQTRQTPVLSDRITSLKFSPDWTVPQSIMEKDYLDKIRANPNYVFTAGFEVYQRGRVVNPFHVNWNDENISAKVTLRKPPSSRGPLGGVRFSLTNDQAIYLHDTPTKNLFSSADRAHSSGCVRVSQPTELAEYMLEGTAWDRTRIQNAMYAGSIEVARPTENVQVFLSYMTAFVDADGRLQLANDLYDLDRDLIARLL